MTEAQQNKQLLKRLDAIALRLNKAQGALAVLRVEFGSMKPLDKKELEASLKILKAQMAELELFFQENCPHPTEAVESQFNESEQYAICTLCNFDLTKEYLAKMPEMDLDDIQERMVF